MLLNTPKESCSPMTDIREHAITAVRNFRRMADELQARNVGIAGGLVLPETSASRAREFTSRMDAETARLMQAFPEFTPSDWEVFIDLVPNVRKLLNMGGKTL